MPSNARVFALPLLGLLVLGAWFLFRLRDPPPAVTSSPPPAERATTPEGERSDGEPQRRGASAESVATPGRPAPPPSTVRDRQRSDEARQALRERFGGSAGGERRPSAPDEDDGAPTGALNKDYIRDRIQQDLVPIAKECYESALEDDPKLAGKLVMTFGIAGDEEVGGVVDEAAVDPSSTLTHPELGECMRESMMSLSFPAPQGGGRVAVTYPFEFSPGDPPPKASP